GAEAAARVLQHAELDAPSEMPAARREGGPQHGGEVGVRAREQRARLVARERPVEERLLGEPPVRSRGGQRRRRVVAPAHAHLLVAGFPSWPGPPAPPPPGPG